MDGVIAIVKQDCPTCELVAPVLIELHKTAAIQVVASQDDPTFPPGMPVCDDQSLQISWRLSIDTVPTVIRFADGKEVGRLEGWNTEQWGAFFPTANGPTDLGKQYPTMPPWRPGCGSMTQDFGMPEKLAARYDGELLASRRVELAHVDDDWEQMFSRGWSDGLPVVPPTPKRVMRMLTGTTRHPQDIVAIVPPDLVECTIEKIAINAVMAGCLPEYLPVIIAALEAACTPEFNAHGLLATTYFAGPVIIVNGPIAKRIGMNSGVNVLGQGNRANSTIGRALQLIIRNVGGGRPGEVDRATLGNPGKVGFSFAEAEATSAWTSLATERGIEVGRSAVTLFAGEGPRALVDQKSRTADSLARSFAACLRSVGHPKLPMAFDAIVVVSPEHMRTFASEGWDKDRLRAEVLSHLQLPGSEIVRGVDGIAEGIPEAFVDSTLAKFRDGGLWFVHAGGDAGMFSAIIGGWVSGQEGSSMVTRSIDLEKL
jgi:thiol-disulfide isomerase/thioredoxin